jgi:short-subunit dehydrogenase
MSSKVVLITGCSSGVGRSLAIQLAKSTTPSYRVYATMRNLSKQKSLVDGAGDTFNKSLFVKALDVSEEASVLTAVKEIVAAEGRLDVLVNNAGQGLSGPVDNQSMEVIQAIIDINFTGVIRTTKAVLPTMKKQESGQIINVTSVGGIVGVPFNEIYCAAKFAVEGFSEALAPVLKAFNIKVNLIEPGPILTDFSANLGRSDSDKAELDSKTQALYSTYAQNMLAGFKPELAQTGDQVAEIIKNTIEAAEPSFRTQTHPNAMFRVGDRKFTDPSGDASVNLAYQRYLKSA